MAKTKQWYLFLAVMLMDLLVGMEFDLFVPSFPDMQQAFHLSAAQIESLLSINFVGYCVSLFFVGSLADRFGRRPVLLFGLGLFILGSILCVWAPYFFCILLGRCIQGIGIAAPSILSFLIIADHYPMQQQQRLMAWLNASMNTAAGIAPVLGSYITLWGHWRSNFSVLLILGWIVLTLGYYVIPDSQASHRAEATHWRSYFTLFRSKPLVWIMSHFIIMCLPYWVFVGISPLLFIQDFHVGLNHFGFYQGSLALVFALGCVLFGFLIKWFSQRSLLYAGLFIFIASLFCLFWISLEEPQSPLWITAGMILFCIGQIIPSSILYPISLNILPQAKGRVSAIMQSGRLILSATALQIAGYYYQHSFQNVGLMICAMILVVVLSLGVILKSGYDVIH